LHLVHGRTVAKGRNQSLETIRVQDGVDALDLDLVFVSTALRRQRSNDRPKRIEVTWHRALRIPGGENAEALSHERAKFAGALLSLESFFTPQLATGSYQLTKALIHLMHQDGFARAVVIVVLDAVGLTDHCVINFHSFKRAVAV